MKVLARKDITYQLLKDTLIGQKVTAIDVPQDDKEIADQLKELKESLTKQWRIVCAKDKKRRMKIQEKAEAIKKLE